MLDTYAARLLGPADRGLPRAGDPPARRAAAARLADGDHAQAPPAARWCTTGCSWCCWSRLTALLAYLAREYRVEHDLTRSHRNTLSPATLDVLKRLDGPVSVTAYAMARDARGEHLHRRIEEFLRPYQRAKPDITLTLVDPREQPKAAAEAGVRAPVELVVEYKRRTEHLTEFNEQALRQRR